MKSKLDKAAGWRDERTRDGLESLVAPFIENLCEPFGESSKFDFRQDCAARSTSFALSLVRNRVSVPLACLSDGETVLTAAAFPDAFQSIKPGPGTALALNAEVVATAPFDRLIAALPKFDVAQMIIAKQPRAVRGVRSSASGQHELIGGSHGRGSTGCGGVD